MDSYVDQYGFLSTTPTEQGYFHRDNARLEKWEDMLRRWEFMCRSRKEKLKLRTRKGIPDCLRGKIWYDLSHAEERKLSYPPGHFTALVEKPGDEDIQEQIRRDLARTFPNHILFQQSKGQEALFHVLKAYAEFDPEVGYIQGMSFITALLLIYMSEEHAFWVLVEIIQRYGMRGFYLPGMLKAHLIFYQVDELLRIFVPNVYSHFQDIRMTPFLYCTAWFMTVCAHQFPMQTLVRIFDCFLNEGLKVIYRVTLAIMKIGKPQLLHTPDMSGALQVLKQLPTEIDADRLIRTAFKFGFSRKMLEALENRFQSL